MFGLKKEKEIEKEREEIRNGGKKRFPLLFGSRRNLKKYKIKLKIEKNALFQYSFHSPTMISCYSNTN